MPASSLCDLLVSFIPPFLFVLITHGQLLSSVWPNLPRLSKKCGSKTHIGFSPLSSAVALVGNWKCGGTHFPAALQPNIPVRASANFDTDLLVNGRRLARVERNFRQVDVLDLTCCSAPPWNVRFPIVSNAGKGKVEFDQKDPKIY